MGKVTSKRQVSIPKAVADRYGIEPGDEIEWVPAGDEIRVVVGPVRVPALSPAERLRLFDRATQRREARKEGAPTGPPASSSERGWSRTELYDRGRSG